jgi:hypothetical protein
MTKKLFTATQDLLENGGGDNANFFGTTDTAQVLRENVTSRSIFSY